MDRIREHSTYLVIEFDDQRQVSQTASPVEEISLQFTVQVRHSYYVEVGGFTSLVQQYDSGKIPFTNHQLDVNIFKSGDETLQQHLSSQWARYENGIDSKVVADTIIRKWIQIKEQENSSMFGKVFPMRVNLICWEVETSNHQEESNMMVPTTEIAIEEMLKQVKMEDQSCAICLEEFNKEENAVLEMPCLHVFHGECIQKWLKISHYCPLCRFQMPTN